MIIKNKYYSIYLQYYIYKKKSNNIYIYRRKSPITKPLLIPTPSRISVNIRVIKK